MRDLIICRRNSKPAPHYCKELLCDGKKKKELNDSRLCEYLQWVKVQYNAYTSPKETIGHSVDVNGYCNKGCC